MSRESIKLPNLEYVSHSWLNLTLVVSHYPEIRRLMYNTYSKIKIYGTNEHLPRRRGIFLIGLYIYGVSSSLI